MLINGANKKVVFPFPVSPTCLRFHLSSTLLLLMCGKFRKIVINEFSLILGQFLQNFHSHHARNCVQEHRIQGHQVESQDIKPPVEIVRL